MSDVKAARYTTADAQRALYELVSLVVPDSLSQLTDYLFRQSVVGAFRY